MKSEAPAADAAKTPESDAEFFPAEGEKPKADEDADFFPSDDAGEAEPVDLSAWTEELTLDGYKELFADEDVELDEDMAGKFLETLNGAESKTELAKSLSSLYLDAEKDIAETIADNWNTMQKEWRDEVRSHPELGGANLERSLAKANELISTHSSDPAAVRRLLAQTGAGSNIAMVEFLNKLADVIPGEAAPVEGKPGATPLSLADRLFGDLTKT